MNMPMRHIRATKNEHAFIFCDCLSAIDIVCKQSDVTTRPKKMKNIWQMLKMLKSIGISIIIIWCPGHCDILYNDMADEEAKRSAEMLSLVSEYDDPVKKLDLSTVKMIIKEEQTRVWQLFWELSVSGGSTRDLIPSVRKNITWSGIRTVDMSYTRILLNSTNLNNDMFSKGLTESPNCECGKNRDSGSFPS